MNEKMSRRSVSVRASLAAAVLLVVLAGISAPAHVAADSAQLHNNAGLAYYYQGKDDLAYDEFVKALEQDPTLASPHYNLARLFERQTRYDQALQQYREALVLDPNMEEALRAVERLQGQPAVPPGLEEPAAAIPSGGNLEEEARAIEASIQKGDTAAARARLDQLLASNPSSIPLLLLSAKLDEKRGNIAGAVSSMQKARSLEPGSAPIAVDLAELLYRAGLFDQAAEEADRAADLNPALATPYRILGLITLSKQKPVEANAYFVEAARLDPADQVSRAQVVKLSKQLGLIHYNAGLFYFQQQDWIRAKEELEQAIALGNLTPDQRALAQQYLVIAEFSSARVLEQIKDLQAARQNEQVGRISKDVRFQEVERSPTIWPEGRHVEYDGYIVATRELNEGSEILVTRQVNEFRFRETDSGNIGQFDQSFRSNAEMDNWFRIVTPKRLPVDARIRPTSRIRVEGVLGEPKTVRNPYNRLFSRRPLPTVQATRLEIERERRLASRNSVSSFRDTLGRDSATNRDPLRTRFPNPPLDTDPGLSGPLKIDYLQLPAPRRRLLDLGG